MKRNISHSEIEIHFLTYFQFVYEHSCVIEW